jgi:hypothetical protein
MYIALIDFHLVLEKQNSFNTMNTIKYIFILLLIFVTLEVKCQREVYLSNPSFTRVLITYQNYLLVRAFDSQSERHNIVMYDLLDIEPEGNVIFSSDETISDLVIYGDSLYFSISNRLESSIQVIDLMYPDNEPEVLLEVDFNPILLTVIQNRLFVSAADSTTEFDSSIQRLLEYDLGALDHGPILIADSLNIVDLDIYDDELIFYEGESESIFIYDTEIEFLFNVLEAFNGSVAINDVAIRGNELFLPNSVWTPFIRSGEILKVDLSKLENGISVFSDEVCLPHSVAVNDSFIYVLEQGIFEFCPKVVSRINLDDEITSVSQIRGGNDIIVYPNPVADVLFVQDKEAGDYKIFNLDGKQVLSGILDLNKQINLTVIPNGFYYILFDDGSTAKFQKINGN